MHDYMGQSKNLVLNDSICIVLLAQGYGMFSYIHVYKPGFIWSNLLISNMNHSQKNNFLFPWFVSYFFFLPFFFSTFFSLDLSFFGPVPSCTHS